MLSVFPVAGFCSWQQKAQKSYVACIGTDFCTRLCCLHFRRWTIVQLITSLSLTITSHRLVDRQKARDGKNEKERSKSFRSLLNNSHYCAGLPAPCRRSDYRKSSTFVYTIVYRCTIYNVGIRALLVPRGPRKSTSFRAIYLCSL
jgi:hypothetical protein